LEALVNVLLSVKPRFVKLIFEGIKRFEYRKAGFARDDVDKVIVYASSPVKCIIGEFLIGEMILDTPESVWARTSRDAGIDRELFFAYFSGRRKACAIGIRHAVRYGVPIDPRKHVPDFAPPQSFRYLRDLDWIASDPSPCL
jgi:predicted transcriptional regulator